MPQADQPQLDGERTAPANMRPPGKQPRSEAVTVRALWRLLVRTGRKMHQRAFDRCQHLDVTDRSDPPSCTDCGATQR